MTLKPDDIMRVISLNIAMPESLLIKGRADSTGIYKRPVSGPRMVRRHNIEGDGQADLSVHGGPDKAVYAYPVEHYDAWRESLDLPSWDFGLFGENLSLEGLIEESVHIGDTFRIGGAVLQITQPRRPCYKLAHRLGLPGEFLKTFLESRRVGYYFRVLEEGLVCAGDPVERLSVDPEKVTVHDMVGLRFFRPLDARLLDRALKIEFLSPAWRKDLEKRLVEKTEG